MISLIVIMWLGPLSDHDAITSYVIDGFRDAQECERVARIVKDQKKGYRYETSTLCVTRASR